MKPACASLLLLAALPAWADGSWCAPPRREVRVAGDDFRSGLANWRVEAQDPRAEVRVEQGVLDVQTPAGLSLWWRQPLGGDYAIRFTATALPAPASAGPLADRISDLNMFWNATEGDGREPQPRDGAFASYDGLRLYYAGFGANGNTTTRLRFYDGRGARELLAGWADEAMSAHTRLVAGRPLRVQIVSRRPTADDRTHLRWSADGHTLFTRADPAPLLRGWFAFRTTASRFQLRDFEVLACRAPQP